MKKLNRILFFFLLSIISFQGKSSESLKILFLGDSLTEGYGVSKKSGYPMVAKEFLEKKGLKVEVLNGSVSGSTTASSASRLKWFLKSKPDLLFLALGANDGLRGIKVEESQKNLAKTIEMAKAAGIKIVLAGMMVPPNYGPEYGKKFKQMYPDLSKKYGIYHLPFLLKDVAGEEKLNQEDGIHPNELGHVKMGEHVGEFLYKILSSQKE